LIDKQLKRKGLFSLTGVSYMNQTMSLCPAMVLLCIHLNILGSES